MNTNTSACLSNQAYLSDPDETAETIGRLADLFLDTGNGGRDPSTILDFTQEEPVIIRQGEGKL